MKKFCVYASLLTALFLGLFSVSCCCDSSADTYSEAEMLVFSQAIASSSAAEMGKVLEILPGRSTRSIPPIHNVPVKIQSNDEVLTLSFQYRGDSCPIEIGETYLFTGEMFESSAFFTKTMWVKESLQTIVRNELNVRKSDLKKFELSVKQVLPEKIEKYQNPYGNGVFEFTLKNNSDKNIHCPGNNASFQSALRVIVNETTYQFPKPEDRVCDTLKPGESKTYTVNTLLLEGMTWPKGGARVYFTFVLEPFKPVTSFFYYYSKLHDPMLPASSKK